MLSLDSRNLPSLEELKIKEVGIQVSPNSVLEESKLTKGDALIDPSPKKTTGIAGNL